MRSMKQVLIGACAALLSLAAAVSESLALDCLTAAPIPDKSVCFAEYVPRGTRTVDRRIETWLADAQPQGTAIRSFAFVISIANYPSFPAPDRVLDAVNVDLPNLIKFLKEQQFDEIIVLNDGNATVDNIRKVFDYLISQVQLYRSRFLFAYDGHGTKPFVAAGLPGGMALAAAQGDNDSDSARVYPLNTLQDRLRTVAGFAHQSIALLGSCYSGGIFPPNNAQGENYDDAHRPGAHAVTATDAFSLAWTFAKGGGTVFFDRFIDKVRTDKPDEDDMSAELLVDAAGKVQRGPHTVRLITVVDRVNRALGYPRLNPATNQLYPQLQIGPIAPQKPNQGGAFFFLGYQQNTSGGPSVAVASAPTPLAPTSPTIASVSPSPSPVTTSADAPNWPTFRNYSYIAGQSVAATVTAASTAARYAEPVTFALPESYKIRGIDLSRFNGEVDFTKLRADGLRFVYLKATEGRTRDTMFARNWTAARQANLKVGAYHEVSVCGAADEQFDAIRATVPKLPDALPLALAVEPNIRTTNSGCPDAFTRQVVGDLARNVAEYYGKKPIIYGNATTLSHLVDETLAEFPIWLAKFATKGLEVPTFLGRNPWTLWQVTDRARYQGVAGHVDLNLFYGSDEDFESFAAGIGNAARLRPPQRASTLR
jgi:lysozyme